MKKLIFVFSIIVGILLNNINAQAQNRISSQAKGAIIGGAGGALLGGLLGHNVKGALIGAAIGAGGGYIVGNEHSRSVAKRDAQSDYQNGYYTSNNDNRQSARAYQANYRDKYNKPRYANNRYRD